MARVEMLLYHALPNTGTIEISTTADTGPWTAITLTSTKPIQDALAEWESLADTALPAGDWTFSAAIAANAPAVVTLESGAVGWVKLTPTLALLLGFTDTVIDGAGANSSDLCPLGLFWTEPQQASFGLAAGTAFPVEVEDAELNDYRGGRASAAHYGRGSEVTVDLVVSPDLWAVAEDSPIFGGHAAFKLVGANADAFDEDDLDGYLVCYPIEELERERESEGDACWLQFRCALRDPGAAAVVPDTSTLWSKLTAALPYGYGLYYLGRREGIPTLFLEVAADATAPSDYTLDATLVIDRSARLGCIVDNDSPIAKGFDLEVRLLPSTTVDGYFTRPTRFCQLTTALTASATQAQVDNARPWDDIVVPRVWIGTSCMPYVSSGDKDFTDLDRTVYGRARSYPVGTVVTDGPNVWQGARWDLFAVVLDPCGSYVQGADILTDYACMIWSGYVADRPVRAGTEWAFTVRDQVRRVADPLGVAASGSAVWTEEDDALVAVPTQMTFTCQMSLLPTSGEILNVVIRPFAAYTDGDTARLSQLRKDVVDAMTAAASDAQVVEFHWERGGYGLPLPSDPSINFWYLSIIFTPVVSDVACHLLISRANYTNNIFIPVLAYIGQHTPLNDSTTDELRTLGLMQPTKITGVALAVIIDDGDVDTIPTAGMVVLEAAGKIDYARYTALTVDPDDPAKVHLTLEQRDRIFGEELSAILTGERQDVSVKFLWTDAGSLADVLRHALASTGDAQHGAYDTLAKGQGLGLPNLDEDSFADTFSGLFNDLNFQIYADSGSSIADIFGGILRLSRTALVTRRASDGSVVDVAAADVGSADTGVPVCTITDDMLVSLPGKRPVRVKSAFRVPQRIQATVRTAPVADVPASEGVVNFKDPHLIDWTDEAWELDIYGIAREDLIAVGYGWALSWFRSGENRQIVEIDLALEVEAQAGDIVLLELEDPSIWDYATGAAGIVGLARVLGQQVQLTSGIQTITVAADGIETAGPMSPSIPVAAVNGGATTPTSIDVDDAYYDLFTAAKDGESSWYVIAYEPGQDTPHRYTISTVTLPGGGVTRLTVTAYPSSPVVTLTTAFRITWPVSADDTANQDLYLHTDQRRQWS